LRSLSSKNQKNKQIDLKASQNFNKK